MECVLCKTSAEDPINLGELKRTRGICAHYYCVLMSTTITQSGRDYEGIFGFLDKDIKNELQKCKNRKCVYCKETEATVKCFGKGCNRYFHFPCGLANNCSFTFCDKYQSFCNRHNHHRRIHRQSFKKVKDKECVICLDNITEEESFKDLIVTPCCGLHLMHIICAKKMAINAGYFTKCPVCNNTDVFTNGLKRNGIFVPLKDASWEQQRGAFTDQRYIQHSCNISVCLSTNGREYNTSSGLWEFILCSDCGSFAAHSACLQQKKYLCDTCLGASKLLTKKRQELTPYVKLTKLPDNIYNESQQFENNMDRENENSDKFENDDLFDKTSVSELCYVKVPENCEIYLCNHGENILDSEPRDFKSDMANTCREHQTVRSYKIVQMDFI